MKTFFSMCTYYYLAMLFKSSKCVCASLKRLYLEWKKQKFYKAFVTTIPQPLSLSLVILYMMNLKKMLNRASQRINLSSIIVKKIPNNSGMSGRAIVNLNQYDIR